MTNKILVLDHQNFYAESLKDAGYDVNKQFPFMYIGLGTELPDLVIQDGGEFRNPEEFEDVYLNSVQQAYLGLTRKVLSDIHRSGKSIPMLVVDDGQTMEKGKSYFGAAESLEGLIFNYQLRQSSPEKVVSQVQSMLK